MKIVFMGTPEFAVPSLQILHEAGYEIVGVITATDKLGGRGKNKLIESAVKKYALEHDLLVLQPKNLKNPEFQAELKALEADLQVVVAFRMLPEAVWNMPPIGTINLHGSLLPAYRGAAPLNWAIMNGETTTGVTTFFLQHEIDTGDILMQRSLDIGPNETAGQVHDRMMHLGAEVVLDSVKIIETGTYELQPQDDTKWSKAPKIFHESCEIDFDQPAEKVHNHIRGLSPFPTAWTNYEDQKLKIFQTVVSDEKINLPPGGFKKLEKNRLIIGCNPGNIEVKELQLSGRKRMSTQAFLNGFAINEELILGKQNSL